MNKEITIRTINIIKMCLLKIYQAEDEDYPNRRVVAANQEAIRYYLKDYSEEQQKELRNIINWYDNDCISKLEKAGWKIKEK